MHTLKTIATWTGITLTGLCGVVLLGGGKVTSGFLLVATAFVMVLPVVRGKLPLWARIGLICAVFGVVMLNISTTELPGSSNGMVMACADESARTFTPTGFTFWDQVRYIFGSFLAQAAPS
ncbi:hypothetical protein Bcav_1969 [Beutenbergia cavernae DSM 12333]|uniref:Uncharacterized protein n=1 Tax=Beutenbergia cavernae (strain ATCC BAA-8 / DSM 12333 / CCUG 43141 / JCM 11478 / NBRC 16432 / NCIMB 13614 / HKI 0122) TaxID=471853 RepID=C5C5N3_BEUC1|nr:hypothetical protein [Beutenbergia cavernae]ACQ80224.1 hypothetical protein Bcav_1969 [Beutenbergia cavernae DSM 12333]